MTAADGPLGPRGRRRRPGRRRGRARRARRRPGAAGAAARPVRLPARQVLRRRHRPARASTRSPPSASHDVGRRLDAAAHARARPRRDRASRGTMARPVLRHPARGVRRPAGRRAPSTGGRRAARGTGSRSLRRRGDERRARRRRSRPGSWSGADGAHSVVRPRPLGRRPRAGARSRSAATRPPRPGRRGTQVIRYGDRRQPAYAWAFDRGDGLSNVGYGELLPAPGRTTRRRPGRCCSTSSRSCCPARPTVRATGAATTCRCRAGAGTSPTDRCCWSATPPDWSTR